MVWSLVYRLKGRAQLYVFLLRFSWWYVLGLLGFMIGAASSFARPPGGSLGLLVAASSLAIGLILFARNTREMSHNAADLYSTPLDSSVLDNLRNSDLYAGFQRVKFHGQQALYQPALNRLLDTMSLNFRLQGQKFRLDSKAKSVAPFALRSAFKGGRVIFNDKKVRLGSDLTARNVRSQETVLLQPTDYFSSLCTNDMTGREVKSRKTRSVVFDGLSFMSSNEIILDLSESNCSNHIGVSTIAFAADGRMIYTVQTEASAQSPGLLAPSASGSADLGDTEIESRSLRAFLIKAMERELLEECGLANLSGMRVETHLVGFARHLNRGGKPEFFGVSHLSVPSSSLRVTRKEAVFIAGIEDLRTSRRRVREFKDALSKFHENNKHKLSLQSHLCLTFLQDCPDYLVSRFLDGWFF